MPTRKSWIHRLTDPDADLTLEEFGHVPAALLLREKPMRAWAGELAATLDPNTPITMLEAALLCLAGIRDHTLKASDHAEHLNMIAAVEEGYRAEHVPDWPTTSDERRRLMVRLLDATRTAPEQAALPEATG